MVTAINSFDPLAYLDHIHGAKEALPKTSDNKPAELPSTEETAKVVSLLLGGDTANSKNSITGLLGGNALSDSTLAGVYNTLLFNNSTAFVGEALAAIEQQTQTSKPDPLQQALNSLNTASNAYNQVLLQNAKDALKTNNGQLPPVVA